MRDAYAMHLHSVSSRSLTKVLPDTYTESVCDTLFCLTIKQP